MKLDKNNDVKVSKHFKSSEYVCKCNSLCDGGEVSDELIEKVEWLRELMEEPININSGHRCEQHNTNVGGVKNSTHVRGLAADLSCKHLDKLHLYIETMYPECSIGRYNTFIHLDVRKDSRRWDNREVKTKVEYLPKVDSAEEIEAKLAKIEKDILDE